MYILIRHIMDKGIDYYKKKENDTELKKLTWNRGGDINDLPKNTKIQRLVWKGINTFLFVFLDYLYYLQAESYFRAQQMNLLL